MSTEKNKQPDDLTEAMRRADETAAVSGQLQEAVKSAIAEPVPVFNTHSLALAREFEAKAASLADQIADVDAKIAALQDERTDLMLAYSMLSHGMTAREKGAAK